MNFKKYISSNIQRISLPCAYSVTQSFLHCKGLNRYNNIDFGNLLPKTGKKFTPHKGIEILYYLKIENLRYWWGKKQDIQEQVCRRYISRVEK